MTNYYDCQHAGIPIEVVAKDLFIENAANIVFFKYRVVAANFDSPINCATHEEYKSLWRQAIDINNGVPALRVMITNNTDAANTTKVPRCGQAQSIEETTQYAFYRDANGDVAFNMMNVT